MTVNDAGSDASGAQGDTQAARVRALLDQGQAALQGGRRDRARRFLEAALALDKDNQQAWIGIARLSDDPDLARAIAKHILGLHPGSESAAALLRSVEEPATPPPKPVAATKAPMAADEAEHVAPSTVPVELEGAAEENGAALFVPPWEVDVPVPVWGRRPRVDPRWPRVGTGPARSAWPGQARASVGDERPAPRMRNVMGGDAAAQPSTSNQKGKGPVSETASNSSTDRQPVEPIGPTPGPGEPQLPAEQPSAAETPATPPDALQTQAPAAPELPKAQGIPDQAAQAQPGPAGAPQLQPLPPDKPAWRRAITAAGRVLGHHLLRNAIMAGMLVFVVLGTFSLILFAQNESRTERVRVALGVVTETPLPSATPTQTQTPLPSPTPTQTATPLASPTPSPSATRGPTPTPLPSWVTQRYLPLPTEEKWIEVDLSEQQLTAYEGARVVLKTKVSSGRSRTPTVLGRFRIQRKYESQLMTGPGYYLPGVPYVMYFFGNYALHGAYWHNNWGVPMSYGCINLRKADAKWLYDWADPRMPAGVKALTSGSSNPGTYVLIHE